MLLKDSEHSGLVILKVSPFYNTDPALGISSKDHESLSSPTDANRAEVSSGLELEEEGTRVMELW